MSELKNRIVELLRQADFDTFDLVIRDMETPSWVAAPAVVAVLPPEVFSSDVELEEKNAKLLERVWRYLMENWGSGELYALQALGLYLSEAPIEP